VTRFVHAESSGHLVAVNVEEPAGVAEYAVATPGFAAEDRLAADVDVEDQSVPGQAFGVQVELGDPVSKDLGLEHRELRVEKEERLEPRKVSFDHLDGDSPVV